MIVPAVAGVVNLAFVAALMLGPRRSRLRAPARLRPPPQPLRRHPDARAGDRCPDAAAHGIPLARARLRRPAPMPGAASDRSRSDSRVWVERQDGLRARGRYPLPIPIRSVPAEPVRQCAVPRPTSNDGRWKLHLGRDRDQQLRRAHGVGEGERMGPRTRRLSVRELGDAGRVEPRSICLRAIVGARAVRLKRETSTPGNVGGGARGGADGMATPEGRGIPVDLAAPVPRTPATVGIGILTGEAPGGGEVQRPGVRRRPRPCRWRQERPRATGSTLPEWEALHDRGRWVVRQKQNPGGRKEIVDSPAAVPADARAPATLLTGDGMGDSGPTPRARPAAPRG